MYAIMSRYERMNVCVCRHRVIVCVLAVLQDKAGQAQEATEQTVEQVST